VAPLTRCLAYDEIMSFVASRYQPQVATLLGLDGDGHRPMPLLAKGCVSRMARQLLRDANPSAWFPGARAPEEAIAGLWLYFSGFAESHAISQNLHSVEGAYWHGILHRQEPDNGNARYWLRRSAKHPIHPNLHQQAEWIVDDLSSHLVLPSPWDSLWFADLCDEAARSVSHPNREVALQIQLAEWQLLFDFCASPPSGSDCQG